MIEICFYEVIIFKEYDIRNLSDIQNAIFLSKFRKNYKIFIFQNGEENF